MINNKTRIQKKEQKEQKKENDENSYTLFFLVRMKLEKINGKMKEKFTQIFGISGFYFLLFFRFAFQKGAFQKLRDEKRGEEERRGEGLDLLVP